MGKDINLLKDISIYFDEETLKSIVAKDKYTDQNNIEVLSWNIEEVSGKGDNYLSIVKRLHIKIKLNNAPHDTKVIIKYLPKNIFRRKLLRSAEYFYNEIMFYTEIATRFQTYLTTKNQKQLLCIPRCLAYHLDGENDFIALEDVSILGYRSITRQSCLPYEDCKNIVEAIASFHALSFGYKNENREEFNKMSSLLIETFYRNDIYETSLKYFYDNLFTMAKDALNREYPDSEGGKVFNSYKPSELFKKTVEICSMKDAETSVISQGDTWAPNFMMRKNSSNKNDIMILDFQIARCASPVLDVVFFIYQCTNKIVRDKYYDTLIKNYYSELTRIMKILGSDPDKQYTWNQFQKEVKEQAIYGLMFALFNVPLTLIPENEIVDLDSIKEDVTDIADLSKLTNLEKSDDRRRLADIILHAVEKGYI